MTSAIAWFVRAGLSHGKRRVSARTGFSLSLATAPLGRCWMGVPQGHADRAESWVESPP